MNGREKMPTLLWEYLEETEQDQTSISSEELLKEAEWVLWEAQNTYEENEGKPPHHMQVKALKRYLEELRRTR